MNPSSDNPSLPRAHFLAGCLALTVAVFVVFFPSLMGEFVYDDLVVIEQNRQITELSNIPGLFLSSYWQFPDGEVANVGYYRPLTMALLTVANVLGDGEAKVFHWFSLLIYAASCLAAWRFAARLLRSEGAGFLAALLFAVHPVHVESVAWISSMHDPLFALFGFLALNRLLDWIDGGSKGWPWSTALWFGLALLSKDTALVLLPTALLLNYFRREKTEKRPALARVIGPMTGVLGLYYIARAITFESAWAGFDLQSTDFGVGWMRMAFLRVELIGGSIGLLAWPAELNLFRSFKPSLPPGSSEFLVGVLGSLALASAIALSWMRRNRIALCLTLLLPVTLLPVLLRVQSLGSFPLSERYLFLPVIAFTALFAHVIWQRAPRGIAIGITLAVGAALGARSLMRLPDWANQRGLFEKALAQNPRNPTVHWGLGKLYLEKYRAGGEPADLQRARDLYETGMDLLAEAATEEGSDIFASHDDHLQMNLGLGWSLLYEADVDDFHDFATVRTVFKRVIEYRPKSERGYIGLGVAWLAEGDPNEAGVALRKALKLNPLSPDAHRNMGLLYMRIEEWAEAAKEFRRCTELRDSTNDLIFLARALFESGDLPGAERAAHSAHERQPQDPDPMVLIGQVAEKTKRYGEAIAWLDRAVAVAPEHGMAHLHRGRVLAQMRGKKKEAMEAYVLACRLLPRSFDAHYDLAVLLMASTQPESAVPYFLVAYSLRPPERDLRMRNAASAIHRNDPRTLASLANTDIDRGDFFMGRQWIDLAMAAAPENPAINFTHGMLLIKEDKLEEAAGPLGLAADKLPGSYTAQMEYANALLGLNRETEAKPYLTRCLSLLDDQPMEEGAKDVTRTTIRKALERIEKMLNQMGPTPGTGEG